MTTQEKQDLGREMTPLSRFDYVKIFEPRKHEIGKNGAELPPERWAQELTLMFPKQLTDEKEIQRFNNLKNLVARAAKAFYPDLDVNGKKPDGSPLIKLPFLDGNAYNASKGGKLPHYDGMIYFSVRSIGQKYHLTAESGAIAYMTDSGQIENMLDKRLLYSGCWGRCMVTIYPNAKGTPAGLNFGLSSIIKVKDDAPLFSGGAGDAAKDFKELASDPAERPNNSQMFATSGGLNLDF